MVNWILIVWGIIGLLAIVVYPKIIRWALFGLITYFTIFHDPYYAILFIPLLIIMFIYKWRKK